MSGKLHTCTLCACSECCGACVVVAEYPAEDELVNEVIKAACERVRQGQTLQ